MYIITRQIIREWKGKGGGRRERGMGGGGCRKYITVKNMYVCK